MSQLPCEVVRDLFPSYIEHLTSEVSDQMIEEHVNTCAPCREILQNMKGAQEEPQQTPEEEKHIDFLKKIRRRNKWILRGSIIAVLVILAVVFITRYMIGSYHSDMFGDYFMYDVEVEGNHVSLNSWSVDNIFKSINASFKEEKLDNGDVDLVGEIKSIPSGKIAGVLYGNEFRTAYTASGPIRQIQVNDRILWKDGKTVSNIASAVYMSSHAYIGDMPANNRTANVLSLSNYLGSYWNELLTENPPYEWILHITEDVPQRSKTAREKDMESFGYVLLAAVGNMERVTFDYTVNGKPYQKTVTAEDATQFLGQDIKDCMKDALVLDTLIQKTGLDHYVFGGTR